MKGLENIQLASFFLRIGLAIAFFYAGIAMLFTPQNWIGYIPSWLQAIIPHSIFIPIHAFFEILLAFWLISNKKIYLASVISSLDLISIIIFNYSALDIIFRDLAILSGALALAVINYKEK